MVCREALAPLSMSGQLVLQMSLNGKLPAVVDGQVDLVLAVGGREGLVDD